MNNAIDSSSTMKNKTTVGDGFRFGIGFFIAALVYSIAATVVVLLLVGGSLATLSGGFLNRQIAAPQTRQENPSQGSVTQMVATAEFSSPSESPDSQTPLPIVEISPIVLLDGQGVEFRFDKLRIEKYPNSLSLGQDVIPYGLSAYLSMTNKSEEKRQAVPVLQCELITKAGVGKTLLRQRPQLDAIEQNASLQPGSTLSGWIGVSMLTTDYENWQNFECRSGTDGKYELSLPVEQVMSGFQPEK
jgi:hypothetical protein